MLKSVQIGELTPGMMVTRVIEQHGPVKIRRVGLIKSEAMVKGLTEMGVSVVEVDEAQSFTLEAADPEHSHLEEASASLTPTQRLMEKDKQSAAVDRQLSQQFHRSLFMPAIDEMPSKWRLYFRPYAMLFAFTMIGFALGFLAISIAMSLPSWFKDAPQTVVDTSSSSALQNPVTQSSVIEEPRKVASSGALDQSEVSSLNNEAQSLTEQSESRESGANTRVSATSDNAINQAEQSVRSSANTESIAENQGSAEEPVRSFQTLNGIVLNEGETVLGYGAAEDQLDEQNSSATAAQDSLSTGSMSSDLLNRVNRAAAQLEAEQEQPENEAVEPLNIEEFLQNESVGPVMDLRLNRAEEVQQIKRIVRIDQLPPALLTQMPAMSFSAHMFASNPQDRWVRVNGRRLSEGDFIDDGLSIVEIESERIVLAFKGETFTMNALSDW